MITENQVENSVRNAVKKAGGIAYKFTSPNRRSVPDRLCLLPGGRTFFVECKASGKAASNAQKKEHAKLKKLGFKVFVIDYILKNVEVL